MKNLSYINSPISDQDQQPGEGDQENADGQPHKAAVVLLPGLDLLDFFAGGHQEENYDEWGHEDNVVKHEQEKGLEIKVLGEDGDDREIRRPGAGQFHGRNKGAEGGN